jgi:hypothetical protein
MSLREIFTRFLKLCPVIQVQMTWYNSKECSVSMHGLRRAKIFDQRDTLTSTNSTKLETGNLGSEFWHNYGDVLQFSEHRSQWEGWQPSWRVISYNDLASDSWNKSSLTVVECCNVWNRIMGGIHPQAVERWREIGATSLRFWKPSALVRN